MLKSRELREALLNDNICPECGAKLGMCAKCDTCGFDGFAELILIPGRCVECGRKIDEDGSATKCRHCSI